MRGDRTCAVLSTTRTFGDFSISSASRSDWISSALRSISGDEMVAQDQILKLHDFRSDIADAAVVVLLGFLPRLCVALVVLGERLVDIERIALEADHLRGTDLVDLRRLGQLGFSGRHLCKEAGERFPPPLFGQEGVLQP